MKSRTLVSYIYLLLLIATCFTSKIQDPELVDPEELSEHAAQNTENEEKPTTGSVPADPKPAAKTRGRGRKKNNDDPSAPARIADRILEYIIYIFMTLSGIYVGFSGFKTFRLTMVILGFYVSYYIILFTLSEMEAFDGGSIAHQLGLFFGSLVLGFIFSVLCYILDKINFIIFGAAVACMVGLFQVEFLLDIRLEDDATVFFIVMVACATVFAVVAFFVLDHFIIWGFAFVGGVITPVNGGILLGQLQAFENRATNDKPSTQVLIPFMVIISMMTMAGIAVQYYLRRRLIKKWTDDGDEENPRSTFLEDRY